jgi:hypothetical protein
LFVPRAFSIIAASIHKACRSIGRRCLRPERNTHAVIVTGNEESTTNEWNSVYLTIARLAPNSVREYVLMVTGMVYDSGWATCFNPR